MEVEAPLIVLDNVEKRYRIGDVTVVALHDVTLSISEGEFVSIMGPSGSGKSTLLNILGCLDQPSSGTYELAARRVDRLGDSQLAAIRNRFIGFVFQSFELLPDLDAQGNVELPLIYRGVPRHERHRLSSAALTQVGLSDRTHHRPAQLSGGQQQRVAIARALAAEPSLLLADEPTGNLDSQSGEEIMGIFEQLNRDRRLTIVQVTHDERVATHGDRIVHVLDGAIESIESLASHPVATTE